MVVMCYVDATENKNMRLWHFTFHAEHTFERINGALVKERERERERELWRRRSHFVPIQNTTAVGGRRGRREGRAAVYLI